MTSTNNRFSVGSLGSLGSFPGGVSGPDVSFISMASSTSTVSSSFEIESEVGREAVKEICCSALSRILDFPDDQLEILLGYDEDDQESTKESGMNVARYKYDMTLYVYVHTCTSRLITYLYNQNGPLKTDSLFKAYVI